MPEDIAYFLSGGTTNTDPNLSLGGLPSTIKVKTGLNTLFSQVTKSEAESGGNRYRCIYVSNIASFDINSINTIVSQDEKNLSSINIGISTSNEVQLISVFGAPTSGNFKLKYTVNVGGIVISQTTGSINWQADQSITAENIQSEINLLTYLEDVIISVQGIAGGYGYRVEFFGEDGNRAQNLLEIVDFSVTGSTGFNVSRITPGNPINQVADSTGFENQPPNAVNFTDSVSLLQLRPGDLYGLWIKRSTPADTSGSTQTTNQANIKTQYSQN